MANLRRLRLFVNLDNAPNWPEVPDSTECGNNIILANGLTNDSIILLKFLLSLPFYMDRWPFQELSGFSKTDVAILYSQLIGGTI